MDHLFTRPCTYFDILLVLDSSSTNIDDRDFDPQIFTPLAMTAGCAGAMAHWRESMGEYPKRAKLSHEADCKQINLLAFGDRDKSSPEQWLSNKSFRLL
jgi:hypothetical protein